MNSKEKQIKDFFKSVGFSAALMAGFAFTVIFEAREWEPKYFSGIAIKEAMTLFLVISFTSFTMPVLLNMLFLSSDADTKEKLSILSNMQFVYTFAIGIGVGGLHGAFILFCLGSFSLFFAYIVAGIILVALILTYAIMRKFRKIHELADRKEDKLPAKEVTDLQEESKLEEKVEDKQPVENIVQPVLSA